MVLSVEIIDLTMELSSRTPVFPIYPPPAVHTWTTIKSHGFYSNLLLVVEHTGTHVDAPAHVFEDGTTIDAMPLERFMGKGVVVDASKLKPRELITRSYVEAKIKELGVNVGKGWVVLFYTGYDKKAGTREWYDHPGLDETAAKYLVELGVNAVGIDAPSIDHEPYPAHQQLLSHGIPIYENLTNLDKLVGKVFKFIGLPLRIVKGSASPVRAVAVIEE
jgi:kynurenine formamidase